MQAQAARHQLFIPLILNWLHGDRTVSQSRGTLIRKNAVGEN